MAFAGFTETDFDVFSVPGLAGRMAALKQHVRPKLEQLGQDIQTRMEQTWNIPMYAHVAKHARRTVHPPADSWVAWAEDKRGYKKHPHFQAGVWGTHAFAVFGLISESPLRPLFGRLLYARREEVVRLIPSDYVWLPDHTQPVGYMAAEVGADRLGELADRLIHVRSGELLVGIQSDREDVIRMGPAWVERVWSCFCTVQPLFTWLREQTGA
ncbi:MAG: DUF1054 domain-containing protein [Alicyclobacillus sp.]|nr:DUF1054 domain-containing protein [Alicyclobacillus sp.]